MSVSDGGAAQPGATPSTGLVPKSRDGTNYAEQTSILGFPAPVSLGLPDGQLADHEDRLAELLVGILDAAAPGTWCAATWRGDGHPDHEAVGRAAADACERTGAALLGISGMDVALGQPRRPSGALGPRPVGARAQLGA